MAKKMWKLYKTYPIPCSEILSVKERGRKGQGDEETQVR